MRKLRFSPRSVWASPTARTTLALSLACLVAFAPLARADILIPPGGATPLTAGSTPTSGFPTGSLFYNDASNKLQPLGQGTTGQALLSNGAGATPSFGNVSGSAPAYLNAGPAMMGGF